MSDLADALARVPRPDRASFRPLRFDAADPAQREALARLIDGGAVSAVHDELRGQLAELVETRRPDVKLDATALARAVEERLAGVPGGEHGTWVYYPWSRRLVHLVGEAEYLELRTSRNRNKITAAEQAKLATLQVAVAGLSVGQATAVTLALEGIGRRFRLADFDTLALSNLNRLRAGTHELGLNKAILTARQLYELDPYLDIEPFTDGVRERNLDAFLDGIDLLFEECDDLAMKVRLRERARERRIPVLMETSDRGLFDVERFDREPARALFHGLAGPLDAAKLGGMTTWQKVPTVLRIIGASTMSPRMAASLVDIDATVKTWPQLASAVALGGAISADAARRIALGTFTGSGRFFVDLAELVADGAQAPASPPPDADESALAETARPATLVATASPLTTEKVRAIVAHGVLAPSGGNCQPWRFEHAGRRLRCLIDPARPRSFLDFEERATWLAMGAAVENLRLAAGALGFAAELNALPVAGAACDLAFAAAQLPADPLARQIVPRATNRKLGARVPLDAALLRRLEEEAAVGQVTLRFLTGADELEAAGTLLGRGDRLRFLSPLLHQDMMSELRWTRAAAAARRDGLDLDSLELDPTDRAGLRLIADRRVAETLVVVDGGQGLEKSARKAVAAASAIGLLAVEDPTPARCLAAGRALERIWLSATAEGLAFQPMSALIYLLQRQVAGGAGLPAADRAELARLHPLYEQLFPPLARLTPLLLFRLARATPPSARSLRRHVDEVLTFTEGGPR